VHDDIIIAAGVTTMSLRTPVKGYCTWAS